MGDKLPRSTIKYLLVKDSGLRAKPQAVDAFSKKVMILIANEAARIATVTTGKFRKTITVEDVDVEVNKEVTEDDTTEEVVEESEDAE